MQPKIVADVDDGKWFGYSLKDSKPGGDLPLENAENSVKLHAFIMLLNFRASPRVRIASRNFRMNYL